MYTARLLAFLVRWGGYYYIQLLLTNFAVG
jgi:hypothetical protein